MRACSVVSVKFLGRTFGGARRPVARRTPPRRKGCACGWEQDRSRAAQGAPTYRAAVCSRLSSEFGGCTARVGSSARTRSVSCLLVDTSRKPAVSYPQMLRAAFAESPRLRPFGCLAPASGIPSRTSHERRKKSANSANPHNSPRPASSRPDPTPRFVAPHPPVNWPSFVGLFRDVTALCRPIDCT